MTNRYLLGAGVALAVALGGAQAHAQLFPWNQQGVPGLGISAPRAAGPASTATTRARYRGSVSQGPTVVPLPPRGLANPQRNFDSGFNAGARGGFQWGPWRLEEEYSYRHNGLSSSGLTLTGPLGNTFTTAGGRGSGQNNSHAIMTNVIYDFTVGWPVSPHIGVGIGAVDVITSASINTFTLNNPIGAPIVPATPLSVAPQTFGGTLLHGSGWRFGYQAIAGFRYDFSPAIAFDLDYRYLGTTDQTLTNSARFPFPGGTGGTNCCAGTKFTSSYHAQNIVASVTMKFGAPPAPPPPLPPAPPPPPAQKVFLVFFDWDKYNITAEGERIIQVAAQQYKAGGSVKLQVTGYTDTTGSATPTTSGSPSGGRMPWRPVSPHWVSRAATCPSPGAASTICACRPHRVCASRRTAGSRSSSRNGFALQGPGSSRGDPGEAPQITAALFLSPVLYFPGSGSLIPWGVDRVYFVATTRRSNLQSPLNPEVLIDFEFGTLAPIRRGLFTVRRIERVDVRARRRDRGCIITNSFGCQLTTSRHRDSLTHCLVLRKRRGANEPRFARLHRDCCSNVASGGVLH